MKKHISYLGLMLLGLMMFSCQKDSFNYKPGYVGSSKITIYPEITVTGNDYPLIVKGTAYTDAGATAKAGSADIKVVTSSPVNTNVPGVYTVTYTATNADGFSATAHRHVVVYSTDASAQNNDFSGHYARTSNGSVAVWTKIAPGVYSVFNPGGAPGTNLTVIMFNDTGSHVYIPSQDASDWSPTSSASESSTAGPNGTLAKYSMQIVNPGYGPSLRTFIKQ